MTGNDTQQVWGLSRVKLLDSFSRLGPSAFFLYVVMLKSVELYLLLESHWVDNDAASWPLLVDVVSRISTLCFLVLMTVLFRIRLEPVEKAKRFMPRALGIAGTFFVALITLFPRANLSVMQTVVASSISLLGTALSIIALAHLGRSFSLMADARRLVTSGPYKIVRHPLYLFEQIASIGILLQFISIYTVSMFLAHVLIQFQRIKNEEAVLEKAFPEYDAYRARTARVIPKVY